MKKWVYFIFIGSIGTVFLAIYSSHLKESKQREIENARLQESKQREAGPVGSPEEKKPEADGEAKIRSDAKEAQRVVDAKKDAEKIAKSEAADPDIKNFTRNYINEAKRVVLVTNGEDPDSLRIAQHYAEVRGVPKENILTLPMPKGETISWREFVATIWQPLLAQLVQKKWIDAIPTAHHDAIGRQKYAINGHRIAYLILCRGVPLRIAADPGLVLPGAKPPLDSFLGSNQASVDSELSVLTQTTTPVNGFVANALYRNERPKDYDLAAVVKVARLDGPTFSDANQLVDRAVAAEQTGLLGRAYVDIGGKYPEGDTWLENTVKELALLGFDLGVDRERSTIPLGARFDAPVLYFGWYSDQVTGPFLLPGFQFPPGAIAEHIYSYSAETLHSPRVRWCGPLLAAGVTATVGNVFEPDLHYLHRPDLLLYALARGYTFGDAAYFSLPVLSWQSVAVGDPLYRPFALNFDTQWAQRAKLPERLAGYAVLRRLHQLDHQKKSAEALALAKEAQQRVPSVAVGLELSKRLQAAGEKQAAIDALGFARYLKRVHPDEWALMRECAAQLDKLGASAPARDVYGSLLAEERLPRDLRAPWLREAKMTAARAGDFNQANAWQRELDDLIMQSNAAGP